MKSIEGVLKFLGEIGLDFYESKIYIAVIEHGKQTVYELSKATQISRTNVYRIVERLKLLGLVDEIEVEKKKYIVPSGDEKLELLVKEQESKSNMLRNILPEVKALFTTNNSVTNPDLKVVNYKGYLGVREVLFNLLKAKESIRCMISRDITELLDESDAIDWFAQFQKTNISIRELVTDNFWVGIQTARKSRANSLMRTESITVPRAKLEIYYQAYIFNNQITSITWSNEGHFSSEIFSEKLVQLEKQKFDLIWETRSK